MNILLLVLASFIAWFISSIAGGGSPFIIIRWSISFWVKPFRQLSRRGCCLVTSRGSFYLARHWLAVDLVVLARSSIGAILGASVLPKPNYNGCKFCSDYFFSSILVSGLEKEQSFKVNSWFSYQLVLCTPFFQDLSAVLVPYSVLSELWLKRRWLPPNLPMSWLYMAKMVTYAAFWAMTMPYLGYGWLLVTAAPANWLGSWLWKIRMNSFDSSWLPLWLSVVCYTLGPTRLFLPLVTKTNLSCWMQIWT